MIRYYQRLAPARISDFDQRESAFISGKNKCLSQIAFKVHENDQGLSADC